MHSSTLPANLYSLVKPRIVALLCLTGVSAVLAAGGAPAPETAAFVVAGACVAGGSAALNCWYDRDLDRHMDRTADRPLPSGDLSGTVAFAFAAGLLAVGTLVGLAALPVQSVAYMWLGVASYVGLYTVFLKRRHPAGVVLGGSAGSFPVLAGWTAVRPLALPAVAMALLVFVWTPAHAWALAYVFRDDFAAAGVPTLPVVTSGARAKRATWWAALATAGVAVAIVPLGGALYAPVALVATPLFLLAYRGYARAGSESTAVGAFFSSNLYLAVLFAAWAAGGVASAVSPAVAAATGLVVASAFLALWEAAPALRGVPGTVGAWHRLRRPDVPVAPPADRAAGADERETTATPDGGTRPGENR